MSDPAVKNQQPVLRGFLFALLAVILWSGNFIVARGLHQDIPPISLAFFRWLGATAFLFPVVFAKLKKEGKTLLPHSRYILFTALTGITVFNTLVYIAGHYTTAINLALIGTTAAPVFVFLIASLFLNQQLSAYQYAGVTICVAGILLLLSNGSWRQMSGFRFSAGDWWILAAALSFAIYTLLVRKRPPHLSATVFLFALFLVGTLLLLPFFFWEQSFHSVIRWSPGLIGSLLYLSIGASVLAFLFWNTSIRLLGPAKTALFGNLIPIFSSLEAALILDETLTPVAVVSFFVILSGIITANFPVLQALRRR